MVDFAALRRTMVDCQIRTYDVTDRAVLAAFMAVPREAFVPDDQRASAYLDRSVAVAASGASLLPPMVLARMIQALQVGSGARVAEYGGATGYGAAVLAAMGCDVTLVEPDASMRAMATSALASSAHAAGHAVPRVIDAVGDELFDAIVVNGACEIEPADLLKALEQNGRLVAIMGAGRTGRVVLFTRSAASISGRPVFDAAGPVLPQFVKPPAFVF